MKKSNKAKKKSNEIKKLFKIESVPKNISEALERNKEFLLEALSEAGAVSAEIEYNGSGDSGQVESVIVLDKKGSALKLASNTVKIYSVSSTFEGKGWENKFVLEEKKLGDALSSLAELLLDYNHTDWYNNDAGFGKVVVDLKEGSIKLQHNQRIMTDEYSEFDF